MTVYSQYQNCRYSYSAERFQQLYIPTGRWRQLGQTYSDNKLCGRPRHNMPPPPASWLLTFWPWQWCPSHMWCGLPMCQF